MSLSIAIFIGLGDFLIGHIGEWNFNQLFGFIFIILYIILFILSDKIVLKLSHYYSVREALMIAFLVFQESGIFLRFIFTYGLLLLAILPMFLVIFFAPSMSALFDPLFLQDILNIVLTMSLLTVFVECFIFFGMRYGLKGVFGSLVILTAAFLFKQNPLVFFGILLASEIVLNQMKYSTSAKSGIAAFVSSFLISGILLENQIIIAVSFLIVLPLSFFYMWRTSMDKEILLC